ncbi:hypothetical protein H632_c4823p0, partial [Helicosporidium sp. ATCC 50920]
LIINEIVSRNKDGIRDEDGDKSDWIELLNRGTTPLALSSLQLVLGDAKWKFPAHSTLEAGGYLLVFASAKDRSVAGREMHTNFTLPSELSHLELQKVSKQAGEAPTTLAAIPLPQLEQNQAFGVVGSGQITSFNGPGAAPSV